MMTKEIIENKLFWHHFSGGVLALIWICIEIDIYSVRNTDEYYLGGYNQLSCLCLIILGILVYKVIKIISLKKQLKNGQLCREKKVSLLVIM
mgnify:CR=1 FL=1